MTSIVLLLIGALLIFLGLTNQFETVLDMAEPLPGYESISFPRYLIGALVVLAPAYILERSSKDNAWKYVLLILVMMVVYFYDDIARFSTFIQTETGGLEASGPSGSGKYKAQ